MPSHCLVPQSGYPTVVVWHGMIDGMACYVVCHGMWYGMVCGMAWFVVWHGMWYDMVCGMAWNVVWHGMWYGMVCHMLSHSLSVLPPSPAHIWHGTWYGMVCGKYGVCYLTVLPPSLLTLQCRYVDPSSCVVTLAKPTPPSRVWSHIR